MCSSDLEMSTVRTSTAAILSSASLVKFKSLIPFLYKQITRPVYFINLSARPMTTAFSLIFAFPKPYMAVYGFGKEKIPHDAERLSCLRYAAFFIYSPPVWDGVCGTDPIGHMTPGSTLTRCSMSRVSTRLP